MNRSICLALILTHLALCSPVLHAQDPCPKPARLPVRISEDLTVINVRFGHYQMTEPGELTLSEVDEIPCVPGMIYGWVLQVEGGAQSVTIKEILTLPEAPAEWGKGEAYGLTEISEDRKTGTTTLEIPIKNGVAMKPPWRVVEGDPAGPCRLQLYIDEHLILDQDFLIFDPKTRKVGRAKSGED